jgi:hypothetical protein
MEPRYPGDFEGSRLHRVARGILLHARNILEFVKKGPRAWDHNAALIRVQLGRGSDVWTPVQVCRRALREFEAAVASATKGDVARLHEGARIARAAVSRAAAMNKVVHRP